MFVVTCGKVGVESEARTWFFWVRIAGAHERPVHVKMSREVWADLRNELGRRSGLSGGEWEGQLLDAVTRLAVRRVENGLREGTVSLDEAEPTLRIPFNDKEEIRKLLTNKDCDYRASAGRDPFCTATTELSDAITLERAAPGEPTSTPVCLKCDLPPRDVLCARLVHPRVKRGVTGRQGERAVASAVCDAGHQEQTDAASSKCRAGGHDCWERLVEPNAKAIRSGDPLAVANAVDSLDDTWRLAFGKARRLVRLGRAADVAELGQRVRDLDSFKAKLSAFADLLKRFDVPDDLCAESSVQKDHTLARLEQALVARAASRTADIKRAVATLRAVNTARVSFQHGNDERVRAMAQLGVELPPASYADAWDVVASQICGGLDVLRSVLREIADGSGEVTDTPGSGRDASNK